MNSFLTLLKLLFSFFSQLRAKTTLLNSTSQYKHSTDTPLRNDKFVVAMNDGAINRSARMRSEFGQGVLFVTIVSVCVPMLASVCNMTI